MAQRVSSSRFVGRERELAELRGLLSAADALPAIRFLAGESGVGKSRLLSELVQSWEADGGRAIGGSCIELGEDELPYAPLVAALRPLQRTCEPVLDQLSPATRGQLARLSPEIGEPWNESEGERGEAQRLLFEAILELIAELGEEGPVLLWIEDVHWADSSTRSFLRFLCASLADEPVLAVVSYRADEMHRRHPLRPLLAELERAPRAGRIELRRFDRAELAAQLEDILGESPSDDVVERLFGRSEGNPLFTEELLAAGLDGRGTLPPSLREALLLRAERLSAECQALLRTLAVAGRAGEAVLAAATGLEAAQQSAALREAMDAQIVVLEGDRFGFRHALLREVIYDDLLPGERAELHVRVGDAIERVEVQAGTAWSATAVAHHYNAGGDQPRALVAAVRAAEAVRSLHAFGEAAVLLDRALALWPRVEDAEALAGMDEPELLSVAARVHYLAGEDDVAEALYERAADAVAGSDDPERIATVLTQLALSQWMLGRSERSRETQRRALAALPAGTESPARVRLLAQQVRFLLLQGRFNEAIEVAPEALEAAEALGMDSERASVLNRYGCSLFAVGEEEEARRRMAESIELAERTGLSDDVATAYSNYADSLHFTGHGAAALELMDEGLERALELIESKGAPNRAVRFMHLNLAEMSFDLGDWDRVERELREAGPSAQGVYRATYLLHFAQLALGRGRDEEAEAALDEAADLLRDALEPQYIAVLINQRAELARRRGNHEAARRAVDHGIDRIQFCSDDGMRIAMIAMAGLTTEAEVAQRACDLDDEEGRREALRRGEHFLELVRAATEERRIPVEGAYLANAEAEAARLRGEDDPRLWAEAAAGWDAIERPYRRATALWRQAQASLGRGDRRAASVPLAQADEIAKRLGATWLAGEIDGLARRARLAPLQLPGEPGAEPEEPAEAPFGLTDRELQVLELVSRGCTNREIGERLYMAEKTASVHVSRILAKLEVRGRTEAAAVAHRHGIGVEERV